MEIMSRGGGCPLTHQNSETFRYSVICIDYRTQFNRKFANITQFLSHLFVRYQFQLHLDFFSSFYTARRHCEGIPHTDRSRTKPDRSRARRDKSQGSGTCGKFEEIQGEIRSVERRHHEGAVRSSETDFRTLLRVAGRINGQNRTYCRAFDANRQRHRSKRLHYT